VVVKFNFLNAVIPAQVGILLLQDPDFRRDDVTPEARHSGERRNLLAIE
jgi:hypothetical protein